MRYCSLHYRDLCNGAFFCHKVAESYEKDGLKGANDQILQFTNSSVFKVSEQRALREGKFSIADFQFTEQAKVRLQEGLASSIRLGTALKYMYEDEIKTTGHKESRHQILYNALSEWAHPSQLSLFQNYAEGAEYTDTSLGTVHVHQAANLYASEALLFINGVSTLIEFMEHISKLLSFLSEKEDLDRRKQLLEFTQGLISSIISD